MDSELAPDICNCLALRKAARRISQAYDAALAPAGLRATQFAILATLKRTGAAPLSALAQRLGLDRTTMGKNLRPLETAGLVEVSPSPADGRTRLAALTERGQALLSTATPYWRAAQEQFEARNGVETAAALRVTLAGLQIGPDANVRVAWSSRGPA